MLFRSIRKEGVNEPVERGPGKGSPQPRSASARKREPPRGTGWSWVLPGSALGVGTQCRCVRGSRRDQTLGISHRSPIVGGNDLTTLQRAGERRCALACFSKRSAQAQGRKTQTQTRTHAPFLLLAGPFSHSVVCVLSHSVVSDSLRPHGL